MMSSTLPSSCLPICGPSPPSSSFRFMFLHVEANQSDDAGSVSVTSAESAESGRSVVPSEGTSVVSASAGVTSREYSSISFSSSRVLSASDGSCDMVFVNRVYSFQSSSAGPTSLTSRLSRSAFSSMNGGWAGAAWQSWATNTTDATKIVKHCKHHTSLRIITRDYTILN